MRNTGQWGSRLHRMPGLAAVLLLLATLASLCAAQEGTDPLAQAGAASDDAAALLQGGATGQPVQRLQQEVIAQLDEMIARLKQSVTITKSQEQGREARIKGEPGPATAAPQRPLAESIQGAEPWQYGRLRESAEVDKAWMAELPQAERQKVNDTFSSGRLPVRYRDLLREYNKRLAEAGSGQ